MLFPVGLVKKLLIKPKMQIRLVNAPEGTLDLIGELPPEVTVVEQAEPGTLDLIILFVKSLAELDGLVPQAKTTLKYDALLWIAYPKKSSKIKTDIDRDTGWAKMKTFGLTGVAMVAMDETWSVMRYRPAERVGK